MFFEDVSNFIVSILNYNSSLDVFRLQLRGQPKCTSAVKRQNREEESATEPGDLRNICL